MNCDSNTAGMARAQREGMSRAQQEARVQAAPPVKSRVDALSASVAMVWDIRTALIDLRGRIQGEPAPQAEADNRVSWCLHDLLEHGPQTLDTVRAQCLSLIDDIESMLR